MLTSVMIIEISDKLKIKKNQFLKFKGVKCSIFVSISYNSNHYCSGLAQMSEILSYTTN